MVESTTDRPKDAITPTSLYLHCQSAYSGMLRQAKGVVVQKEGDPDKADLGTMVVWEGFLTRFITEELHLSVPYYSSVTQALKRMGCIRQLRRGGGSSPSQWELKHEPTEDLFNNTLPKKSLILTPLQQLQKQVNDQEVRLKDIEAMLEGIIREAEANSHGIQ